MIFSDHEGCVYLSNIVLDTLMECCLGWSSLFVRVPEWKRLTTKDYMHYRKKDPKKCVYNMKKGQMCVDCNAIDVFSPKRNFKGI